MSPTQVLPHDLDAERHAIGAALFWRPAADCLMTECVPEDFYMPYHGEVVAAIRKLYSTGYAVDLGSVSTELARAGIEKRNPNSAADLLSMHDSRNRSDNRRAVAQVVELAVRRRAILALHAAAEGLHDLGTDLAVTADAARQAVGTIEMPILATEPDDDLDVFLAGDDHYDWLVDGLLERGDRCIVTGVEGKGKSVLLRQLALCFASGVHPFTLAKIPPLRVMLLDLENSRPQTKRGLRTIRHDLSRQSYRPPPGNLRAVVRTEGIDLLSRSDVRWLYERFEANRPEIVVGGPLYKMHAGNPNDEGPAAAVAKVWDVARTRYGFAMVLEAHAPHGAAGVARDMRPYGASLWRRWPEFGLGLAVDRDDQNVSHLRTWRGSRDERAWPTRLRRGGVLPWTVERRPVPNQPDAELLPGPDQRSTRHARY